MGLMGLSGLGAAIARCGNESKQLREAGSGRWVTSPHTMRQPYSDAAMKTLLFMLALVLCLLFLEQAWLPTAQADECDNLGPAQTLQCAAYGAGNVVPE
jgi:hypothetical protein